MEKHVSDDMVGEIVSFIWDGDAPNTQSHKVVGRVINVNKRDDTVNVHPLDEPYEYHHIKIDKVRFL